MIETIKSLLGHDHRNPLPDLDTLRARVVRLTLGYLLVFSAPVLLVGLHRSMNEQWNWYAAVQLSSYLSLAVGFALGKRIGSQALSLLIVAIVLLVGVCGIAAWGPAPSRFVVLSFGCVFAAMFNGARFAIGTLGVATALICVAAGLHEEVQIIDGGDSVSDHSPKQWVVTVLSFAFYTACGSLLVAWVTRSLQNTITILRGREEELRHSNEMLQEQAVRLEEQATVLEDQAVVLQEERDRADAAAKAKDRFLSVISHELRTPLNPILGFLDLLHEDQGLRPESKLQLDLMRRSSEHLLRMIDKVVDFSELDRRELILVRRPAAWDDLRRGIACRLQMLADERGLELRINCPPSTHPGVVLDLRRTLQIIEELGTNALRFTESGCVSIDIGLENGPGEQTWLTIAVADTGCGFEFSDQAQLFDAFLQNSVERSRASGGFGLGLPVCSAIATAMGGRIDAESELGVGSRFQVAFPVTLAPVAVADASEKTQRRWFESPLKVLIAEDDFVNQKVVKSLLKRMGANGTCVENGKKAVEALLQNAFDVVLMDISMPIMDGITATREIRSQGAARDVPIIALTAHSYAASEEACFDAGMNAFLTKPVQADELFRTISRIVKLNAASVRAAAPN